MIYNDNIAEVAALQPDYLGFIFYEKSPRYFQEQIPQLSKNIKKVGVFVDASLDYILDKITKYNLKAVQLHGNESPEFCKELKCHYEEQSDVVISSKEKDFHAFQEKSSNDNSIEIIKVFSIKDEFNFDVLKPYESVCDYFLFDTKGKLPGGNGYTFDWSVLNNYPSTKPFFLSGGIGLDQIKNIKSLLNSQASKYCYAFDVNSKFEIEAGLKNIEDLEEFIKEL